MADIQKITPSLWFDSRTKEAAEFYTAVFPNSKMLSVSSIEGGPAEGGHIVSFELAGQQFSAFDGGPAFKFTPAISFTINCDSQDEVDYFWGRLSDGGEKEMCGWVRDKFGVSWQVVPVALFELMSDPSKAPAVTETMLTMKKLDIRKLQEAYNRA